MTLEEQKHVEDSILQLLDLLTPGEKAVLYKTLHAQGLRLAHCDTVIRKASPPVYPRTKQEGVSQAHLPRGLPPSRLFP
jgi:hypothetical protein